MKRGLPRLTTPLVRQPGSPRGASSLRPATWEEALDRAALGIQKSVAAHGPSTFGVFSCSKATNEINYMAMKVTRAVVGSNNIDSCNRT